MFVSDLVMPQGIGTDGMKTNIKQETAKVTFRGLLLYEGGEIVSG